VTAITMPDVQSAWGHISPDILRQVAPMLGPRELARSCGVCMEWFRVFQEDSHWVDHCQRELPSIETLLDDMPIPSYRSVLHVTQPQGRPS
jgi:hypothetical protein